MFLITDWEDSLLCKRSVHSLVLRRQTYVLVVSSRLSSYARGYSVLLLTRLQRFCGVRPCPLLGRGFPIGLLSSVAGVLCLLSLTNVLLLGISVRGVKIIHYFYTFCCFSLRGEGVELSCETPLFDSASICRFSFNCNALEFTCQSWSTIRPCRPNHIVNNKFGSNVPQEPENISRPLEASWYLVRNKRACVDVLVPSAPMVTAPGKHCPPQGRMNVLCVV